MASALRIEDGWDAGAINSENQSPVNVQTQGPSVKTQDPSHPSNPKAGLLGARSSAKGRLQDDNLSPRRGCAALDSPGMILARAKARVLFVDALSRGLKSLAPPLESGGFYGAG